MISAISQSPAVQIPATAETVSVNTEQSKIKAATTETTQSVQSIKNKRNDLPDDEKWKYDLVSYLLKNGKYVPQKSFYSRFELFV